MSDYQYVTYEVVGEAESIARVMMDRPATRNAQNRGLLVELDDALLRAERDDAIRVVILGGNGASFSSGHDLGTPEYVEEVLGPRKHPTWECNGGTRQGAEQRMLQEWHYFFENTRRWRNLRKITIAEAHGPIYAAGLMLAWCCDLIVASEDTVFADVVGARLGMCGVEYFAHPWELGARKTKELMLTGDAIDVHEAHRLGMVSKIFPRAELGSRTLVLAERIASLPSMTSLLVKESVNQSVDNMGFQNALQACFTLHQLNHAHWAELHDGWPAAKPEDGIPHWKDAPPVRLASKTEVNGAEPAGHVVG